MTNADVAQKVLDYLKETKFKPYSVEYPCKQYNENDAPCGVYDSVIWFRCKGVNRHWRFGMWIHTDIKDAKGNQYEPILQIFAQWDNMIDKFKPTRSALLVNYTTEQLSAGDSWDGFCQLGDMLRMMKRHPLLCFYGFCGEKPGFSSESFLWYFLCQETDYYLTRAKVKVLCTVWYPYCRILVWRAKRYKCVCSCEIYNHAKRYAGMQAKYIYEIQCIFKETATKEDIHKVILIFKKNEYGKYNRGRNCAVGCDYFKKIRNDGFIDCEL